MPSSYTQGYGKTSADTSWIRGWLSKLWPFLSTRCAECDLGFGSLYIPFAIQEQRNDNIVTFAILASQKWS